MTRGFIGLILSLCIVSAYAASAPTSTNAAPISQVPNTQANLNNSDSAPLIFQVGKQKLLVTRGDVVQLAPTQTICVDGVTVQLSPDMANQLHALTSANLNKTLEIMWNGNMLANATISTPLSSTLCIGYVDQATQQALVSAFSATQAPATSAAITAQ